jgi:hypothetical protein
LVDQHLRNVSLCSQGSCYRLSNISCPPSPPPTSPCPSVLNNSCMIYSNLLIMCNRHNKVSIIHIDHALQLFILIIHANNAIMCVNNTECKCISKPASVLTSLLNICCKLRPFGYTWLPTRRPSWPSENMASKILVS